MKNYVGNESQLAAARPIVIGVGVVSMIEPEFWANGDEFIWPISDADGVFGVLGGMTGTAADFVVHIFISNGKEGARRQPEHGVIDDRPFWRVTILHGK